MTITGTRFVCATATLVTFEVKKECLFILGDRRWGVTITKMTDSSTNNHTLGERAFIAKLSFASHPYPFASESLRGESGTSQENLISTAMDQLFVD
jgi:hypothetical protein